VGGCLAHTHTSVPIFRQFLHFVFVCKYTTSAYIYLYIYTYAIKIYSTYTPIKYNYYTSCSAVTALLFGFVTRRETGPIKGRWPCVVRRVGVRRRRPMRKYKNKNRIERAGRIFEKIFLLLLIYARNIKIRKRSWRLSETFGTNVACTSYIERSRKHN